MHFALQNGDGEWVGLDQQAVQASNKLSWFALLPANEDQPHSSGWLLKQDHLFMGMPEDNKVSA